MLLGVIVFTVGAFGVVGFEINKCLPSLPSSNLDFIPVAKIETVAKGTKKSLSMPQ